MLNNVILTRSSADADNGLDAFVGQSRSTNISGPFQVK